MQEKWNTIRAQIEATIADIKLIDRVGHEQFHRINRTVLRDVSRIKHVPCGGVNYSGWKESSDAQIELEKKNN